MGRPFLSDYRCQPRRGSDQTIQINKRQMKLLRDPKSRYEVAIWRKLRQKPSFLQLLANSVSPALGNQKAGARPARCNCGRYFQDCPLLTKNIVVSEQD